MTNPSTSDLQTRNKQALVREGTRPGPVFRPDVDIVERAGEFLVTADLPGVSEDQVSINLAEGALSIDAGLGVQPESSWTPLYAEYELGGYHREFRLSDSIDVDRIEATMRDGVLILRLPKTDHHRQRQIEVRSG